MKAAIFLKDKKFWILVVILAGLVTAGFFAWNYFSKQPVSDEEHQKVIARSEFLSADQQFEQNDELLQEHLEKNLTKEQQTETTLATAVNYQNLKNTQAAFEWYQKYEGLAGEIPAGNIAMSMAQLALEVGDDDAAIRYIERAIEIAPHDSDPFNDLYINDYKRVIENIRSGNNDSDTSGETNE